MHILESPVKGIAKSPRWLLEQTQIDKTEKGFDSSVNNPEKEIDYESQPCYVGNERNNNGFQIPHSAFYTPQLSSP
jgi:hypothetical protein